MKRRIPMLLAAIAGILLLAAPTYNVRSTSAQASSRYFPETKHTVQGRFLQFWDRNGGLLQYGYPISDEMPEVSDVDGKLYTVQYFERAVFEWHPDNKAPYDVLLSLLGSQRYVEAYGPRGVPNQGASTDNARFFPETGRTMGGAFRAYWETHGGLQQQGYPISDEFQEVDALDGKLYTVQYFERAVFELHPERKGTPYEVLLTQLGTYRQRSMYGRLDIPGPSSPDLVQMYPSGSESYLVWSEVRITLSSFPNQRPVYMMTAILALDLHTNRTFTVANNPNLLFQPPRLSGSTVVWQERDNSCPNCYGKLVARDLHTDTTVTVIEGAGMRYSPSIWGRTVVWCERNENYQQVMAKDLDTGTISIFTSKPATQSLVLASPLISGRYVAWVETDPRVPGVYKLQAASRSTREVHEVAHGTSGSYPYESADIFGSYLVWSDPSTKLADLDTGKVSFVTEDSTIAPPTIRGNTLV